MDKSSKKLIIFFIPPKKVIDGGLMSIFSLCKESRKLVYIHQSDVVISTYPGYPSYKKNDLFPNDETIYSFDEVIKKYPKLDSLLIHFPNAAAKEIYDGLIRHQRYLLRIPAFQINVLNQNIQHMPEIGSIASILNLTSNITQSTAHDSYATQEVCDMYALPLYHLSVFIDSQQYVKTSYQEKLDIIAYSPDEQPLKEKIIKKLKTRFPNFKFIEIRGMTYSEYKTIVSQAKFMITFGEGFDGYLIESAFSGGIPFAVYSHDFFPSSSFQKYQTIYKNYEDMLEKIASDIKELDNDRPYTELNSSFYKKLEDVYNFSHYVSNIKNFYLGKPTFKPGPQSQLKFLLKVIDQKNDVINQNTELIAKYETDIRSYLTELHNVQLADMHKDRIISDISNSLSWKLTRPLRLLSKVLRKSK